MDPAILLGLALAAAWGEAEPDRAVFAVAAALMHDKAALLELFRHGYGTWKWAVEKGWREDKAMQKDDLTDPEYRQAAMDQRWRKAEGWLKRRRLRVVKREGVIRPIDER